MKTVTINKKKQLKGEVVSTKMTGTIVVSVQQYKKAPKYGKYVIHSKRHKAALNGKVVSEGDTVIIEECRPVSKQTHFLVLDVIAKSGSAEVAEETDK